jgi:AbrB family looped-hinge helix DNA binding protein
MAVRARINEQGRLVIPAEIREAAGIRPNSTVLLELDSAGTLRIRNVRAALDKVRGNLQRRVRGKGIVEELIKDRRRDSTRE